MAVDFFAGDCSRKNKQLLSNHVINFTLTVSLLQGSQPEDNTSVSGNTEQDDEADMLADTRHISYKDYVNLWASLLDSPHLKVQ